MKIHLRLKQSLIIILLSKPVINESNNLTTSLSYINETTEPKGISEIM